jgi:hypothetical protein
MPGMPEYVYSQHLGIGGQRETQGSGPVVKHERVVKEVSHDSKFEENPSALTFLPIL